MKFKVRIIIRKPVNEVFRFVTSPTKMPEWTTGLKEIRPIKGRRSKEGSILKHLYKEKGDVMEIKEEILTVKRNEEFKVLLSNKNMVSTVTYLFAENHKITTLNVEIKTKLFPRAMNLFSIFMRIVMKKRQEEDLKKMRKLVERGK